MGGSPGREEGSGRGGEGGLARQGVGYAAGTHDLPVGGSQPHQGSIISSVD